MAIPKTEKAKKAATDSKETIREELAGLDAEIAAKSRDRAYLFYEPNPSQKRFHQSTAFERWVFAGNGTGKDTALVNEFGWHCLGKYPPWYPDEGKINPEGVAIRTRYCCTTFNDGIKQIVVPEFKKWFGDLVDFKEKENLLVFKPTGSTVHFKTYDQKTDSFVGANLDLVGQSEHCPKDKYEENMARLRGTGVKRFVGVMTPSEGQMGWEYDDIFEAFERRKRGPPDLEVLRGKTMDNVDNLSEAYMRRFDHMSPEVRRMRLYGDFVQLSGLVFKDYRDWHIDEVRPGDLAGGHLVRPFQIPAHWPRSMCIDPHNRKPFAMLWRAISPDGNCYYYDEAKPEEGSLLIDDYARLIAQKEGEQHNRISYRLIDTTARIEDPITGVDIQTEFDKHGIRTRVVRHTEKKIDPGIQKISEGFRFSEVPLRPGKYAPRIMIFDNLYELRYELRHYVWDDYVQNADKRDPKDKPRKKDDDLIDCMKYLEMSGARYEQPKLYKPGWKLNPYGT